MLITINYTKDWSVERTSFEAPALYVIDWSYSVERIIPHEVGPDEFIIAEHNADLDATVRQIIENLDLIDLI